MMANRYIYHFHKLCFMLHIIIYDEPKTVMK